MSLVLGGEHGVILILTPLRPSQIDSKWGGPYAPPPPSKSQIFPKASKQRVKVEDFDVIHEFLSCYCELLLNWGVFHEFLSCYYRLLLNWGVFMNSIMLLGDC